MNKDIPTVRQVCEELCERFGYTPYDCSALDNPKLVIGVVEQRYEGHWSDCDYWTRGCDPDRKCTCYNRKRKV